jgi:hypothetical protein
MHAEDDQIVPIGITGLVSARCQQGATLKVYPACRTACVTNKIDNRTFEFITAAITAA